MTVRRRKMQIPYLILRSELMSKAKEADRRHRSIRSSA
ncbi:hypothetical protein ISN45_Aa02g011480 [Arabidopsis thaliana x Arabidopsis arenosa]|uniref:Uncharacterized protein n=2 Tax=Arabidopsis TaxID=3701 RepID=A0A8T2BMW8_ARASU|nr:hypothetical protein ISN45_Aa02g011480 [Arabidopsis thaliana x Arabidopsis arenosa]KAG7588848.1 hypothetical protein ISN44_As07g011700 [Arabidopsis suecica]